MSGLIALSTGLILLVLRLGYNHTMSRFDGIDKNEKQNRAEHAGITKTQVDHGNRLVRIETILNGGKKT
jgi:hypothetical protein